MRKLLWIFVALVSICGVLAYSGSSGSFRLWKAQEGYWQYNSTDEFMLNSAIYEQRINMTLTSPSYDTCEGFYCLFIKLVEPSGPPGGPGGGGPAIPSCSGNKTLVLYNGTHYCADLNQIQKQIELRDLRYLIAFLIIMVFIAYNNKRRKRRRLESQIRRY